MVSGVHGGTGGTVLDHYRDVVLPAVYQGLDAAFPEFGFVRKGEKWVGSAKTDGEHGPLGCRPDRVCVKRFGDGQLPHGFCVVGGGGASWGAEAVPFLGYVLGGRSSVMPRGDQFTRAVAELARRAGVDPGPAEGGKPLSREELARAQRAHEAQRRSAQKAEQRRCRKRLEQVAAIWAAAQPGHEAVRAYLAGRGIDVAALEGTSPGGALPPPALRNLRFHAECPLGTKDAAPALVCAVALRRKLVGLQRIFLDPADWSSKNAELGDKCKMALGPIGGGACRLGDEYLDGVLCLTEGVETAAAVRAATGWTVWACISAGGLTRVDVPEELVADGRVTRIVIAGDCDESGTGQTFSDQAAQRLAQMFDTVQCFAALPERWAPGEWAAAALGGEAA